MQEPLYYDKDHMDKQAQSGLKAYGWFGVLAGLAMLAVAVKQGVTAADGEVLVATVTGIVALFLILVGWMMLTLESRESTGRWPAWGILHSWPSIGAMVAFLAVSAALIAVVYYLGGAMERLMLAAIPADVPARGILAMSGYISGGVWLVFSLPTVALRLAHSARTYSATLERDAASGTMSPV